MGIETPDEKVLVEGETKAKAAQRITDAAVRTQGVSDLPVVFAILFDDGAFEEEERDPGEHAPWKKDLQTSLKKVRSSIV